MPTLEQIQKSKNVAELLDDKELALIGANIVRGYEIDEDSRAEWKEVVDKAMEIAKQTITTKSFPWPGAANIKMPVITRACIDYAARTLPEIIQDEKLVKGVIVGKDPTGEKYRRCLRVSQYMSYQLLVQSPDWEAGMDSLLQSLPVLGTIFKKTYYCDTEKRVISEMCVPDKIAVNYNTQSLETARRITHILTMYKNDVIERQLRGLYLESFKLEELTPNDGDSTEDEDFPFDILEQHCYLDLDEDDYKEPYVVTVHKATQKVLRIVPRFKKVEKLNGAVACITPDHYFTDFHFIKSPDGGFYSMGFGSLLLPLNTAINTLINQLLDAGTLSNTQGGFLGRALRIKNGEFKTKMGEWKVLDAASGTSISDNVYPLPVREPSRTLLELLQLMMQEAKDLSSATDVMLGKQPAQNVASNTVSQLIDQGTKIFKAINKRIYRSLKKEYGKIQELDYYYLSNKDYQKVLDDPLADVKKDFECKSLDIYPIADPTLSSTQERLAKASVIQGLPTVDLRAADEMVLDSMQIDDGLRQKLLPPIDPNAPPPPEQQKIMAEAEYIHAQISNMAQEAAIATAEFQSSQRKLQQDLEESDSRVQEAMSRVWKAQQDALHNHVKDQITAGKAEVEAARKDFQANTATLKDNHAAQLNEVKTSQDDQKLAQEAKKAEMDAILKNKELDIKAAAAGAKRPKTLGAKKHKRNYVDEDVLYTAQLKGMSVQEVLDNLRPDDDDEDEPTMEDIAYTAKLKGISIAQVKKILGFK